MNAAKLIRDEGKAAMYWLGCVEDALSQGDAAGAEYARENAQFCSIRAFRLAQAAA